MKKLLVIVCMLTFAIFVYSNCQTKKNNSNTEVNDNVKKSDIKENPIEKKRDISKKILTNDYIQVCSGIPVEGSTEYKKEEGKISSVYLFSRDDENGQFKKRFATLPKEWEPKWDKANEIQLVACVTRKIGNKKEDCKFKIEGKQYILELYDATYEFKLYEASTGKLISTETKELKSEKCPMYHMFTKSKFKDVKFPKYKQQILEFLKPFVIHTATENKKTENPEDKNNTDEKKSENKQP